MKKTLRRHFGNQLTGALTALLAASLVTMPEALAQGGKPQKSSTPCPEHIETSHDTPPPVLIMDGSFILETAERQFDETEIIPGQPKKYKRRPKLTGKTKVYVAHIKIVDGSGEVVYRGNFHDHASDVRIAVLTETGIVNLASVSNKFQIETPDNKNFTKTTLPSDQPSGGKRLARFRYKSDSNGNEHAIRSVKVTKGSSTLLFDTDLHEVGSEFRVMIWLAEH